MATFRLDFDFCLEGVRNAWEAHGEIMAEAMIETAEVHNVEYIGDAPNRWPMMRITFQCIETAKAYTCAYLGLNQDAWDVHVDDEVNKYVSSGRFMS